MKKEQKDKIVKKINRCGQRTHLRAYLDEAVKKGYVNQTWFTDVLEAQAKFLNAKDVIDRLNQELNSTSVEDETPKEEEEAIFSESENDPENDLDGGVDVIQLYNDRVLSIIKSFVK